MGLTVSATGRDVGAYSGYKREQKLVLTLSTTGTGVGVYCECNRDRDWGLI